MLFFSAYKNIKICLREENVKEERKASFYNGSLDEFCFHDLLATLRCNLFCLFDWWTRFCESLNCCHSFISC